MRYFRDYSSRWNAADPLTRVIVIAAIVLIAAILVPRIPGFGTGVDCNNLTIPPANGTNQSILATTVDPSVLALQLLPEKRNFTPGEALVMTVRFYNSSMAPLTLLIVPAEVVFRYTGQEMGLVFSVQEGSGRVLGEPFSARPPVPVRQQYNSTDLRVLGPRTFCNLRVEISAQRLAASGVGQGQYIITAVYRNQFRGTLPQVGALTPTPTFRDQGVWIGEVRSAPEIITFGVAQ